MLKLPNSIEPAVMAENIVHLRDAENSLDGRVSDLEVTAPKDYSTTETATGQKWIDGKEIYSIVFASDFPEITASTSITVGTLSDKNILDMDLLVRQPSGVTFKNAFNIYYNPLYGTITISNVSTNYSEGSYIVRVLYTNSDPTPGRAPEDQEPEPEEKKTTKKKTTK